MIAAAQGLAYSAFAARLRAGGIISDPWLEGKPRFHPEPVLLTEGEQGALYCAAEEMAKAWTSFVRCAPAIPGWSPGSWA